MKNYMSKIIPAILFGLVILFTSTSSSYFGPKLLESDNVRLWSDNKIAKDDANEIFKYLKDNWVSDETELEKMVVRLTPRDGKINFRIENIILENVDEEVSNFFREFGATAVRTAIPNATVQVILEGQNGEEKALPANQRVQPIADSQANADSKTTEASQADEASQAATR